MMQLKTNLTCLLALIALVACSSGVSSKQTTKAAPSKAVGVSTEGPDASALSVSNLPQGKCGMLLWTKLNGKPSLIFRAVQDEGAEMIVDGVPVTLEQVSQSGELRYGVSNVANYQTQQPEAVKVSIVTNYGLPFEGGNFLNEGKIFVINPDGWENVMSVAGLVGCRS